MRMAFRSGRRGIYREQSWTLSPIIILVCGPQFISSGFTVMTGLGLSQASGKTQPGTAVWESAPWTQAMTTSLACLPSLLPSPCRCLQPLTPSTSRNSHFSPGPHLAAICQAVYWPRCAWEWAPCHGSTRAGLPGGQASMCEPCVCCEAAARPGSLSGGWAVRPCGMIGRWGGREGPGGDAAA